MEELIQSHLEATWHILEAIGQLFTQKPNRLASTIIVNQTSMTNRLKFKTLIDEERDEAKNRVRWRRRLKSKLD